MYFKNRKEAGQKLAELLIPKYATENSVTIAMNNGGVTVGAEIAKRLHCGLTMLLTEPITLPRENDPLAAVDQSGGMTYNSMYSPGELEEYTAEYHNYIEQEKLEKFHRINLILSADGTLERERLHRHNVVLVADGFTSAFSMEAAANFLKPVRIKRLIVAVPLASVQAVDRMHTLADDFYCLSVPDNYVNTNHYYEEQDVPDHDGAMQIIRNVTTEWLRP